MGNPPAKNSVWRHAYVLVRIAALSYGGLLLFLAGCQRHMIYFPSKESSETLGRLAGPAGFEAWLHPDGHPLGWKALAAPASPKPANRLLVFHGNAGFALHRSYFRDGFAALAKGALWEVHILEYPGYGARPGSPGETHFAQAGQEALTTLWQEDQRPVYLLGESIGSGVASRLAGEFPDRVSGVLLITPFTRLADVGAHHYPFLPVRMILRDSYDSAADLREFPGPIAILLAGRDEIIPAAIGRRLHDGITGIKRLWVQPEATHNSIDYHPAATWWREVSDFLLHPQAGE